VKFISQILLHSRKQNNKSIEFMFITTQQHKSRRNNKRYQTTPTALGINKKRSVVKLRIQSEHDSGTKALPSRNTQHSSNISFLPQRVSDVIMVRNTSSSQLSPEEEKKLQTKI
jgi:hypothetical protein